MLFPAILLAALAASTTICSAWALAAWLPHDHLLRRRNVISQPDPKHPGKFLPTYITTYQFSRSGMIRLAWQPGLSRGCQLDTDLSPRSTIALKLPTVNQDRSWGRLPKVLGSSNYGTVPAGGQDARGWPFLALWCHLDEAAPSGHTVRGGITLSSASVTTGAARVLPWLPIWRGLILNMLIYAAAWLVVILVYRRLRAAVRRRRGRCPRCNYDRRKSAGPCPECGARSRLRREDVALGHPHVERSAGERPFP